MKIRHVMLLGIVLYVSGCALNSQCPIPEESFASENVADLTISDAGNIHFPDNY